MDPMDKLSVLKKYFGHSSFRQGQEKLIDAILSGEDALGIMPTGGGKSLCYQVPAMLLSGVTLVISPLISLMKDQVEGLTQSGISAAYINSSLSAEEFRRIYQAARSGCYKLLYVAPERLDTEGFSALVQGLHISLVAVDEAHCISQWGQNFRPSYLRIPDFVASLPQRPVLAAFTATATAQVQSDIVSLLQLHEPVRCVTGFDRPNLFFDVQSPKDKMSALLELLQKRRDKTGIVYCATRSAAERICRSLCDRGISAVCYHAGMADADRQASQDDFQFDRKNVIVATNAFGMGIDKSNVNFVIHYNMPKSLEAYYQEAGRAGRDGEAADCLLLYSAGDIQTAKFLIESSGEGLDEEKQANVRRRDYERLQAMIGYCKTSRCLRSRFVPISTGWRTKGICGQIPTISRWSRRPLPPPFCLAGKRSLCLCAWRISPRARRRAKKTPEAEKTKLRFRCLRPWGAPTCFPPSRLCGCRSRRRRTCRPISSLPTQPLRIWPPKDPIPWRNFWRSPASARKKRHSMERYS